MSFLNVLSCPVCGSVEFIKTFSIIYRSDLVLQKLGIQEKPEIHLKKCVSCRHYFASPRLNDADLKRYYAEINSEFYDFGKGAPEDNNNYDHLRIIRRIEKFIPVGKVLDVGCGYGFLLSKFDKNKWDRYGVDPSPHVYNYAKNHDLKIISGYLDKKTFPEKFKFNAIVVLDVLEHIADPARFLDIVSHYLEDSGLLIIGTGNVRSINARISKKYWAYLGIYEHISFFSPKSLTNLLKKNGFSNIRIKFLSYQNSPKVNFMRLIKNALLRAIKTIIPAFELHALPVAMDHMIVFARKNDV